MTVKKGQTIELEIADVALGGKGLARVEGMVVFVDGAVGGPTSLRNLKKRKLTVTIRLKSGIMVGQKELFPLMENG